MVKQIFRLPYGAWQSHTPYIGYLFAFFGGFFVYGGEAVGDVLVQQLAFFPEEFFKFRQRVDFLYHFGKACVQDGGDFFVGFFVVHAFAQVDVFAFQIGGKLVFGVGVDVKLVNHGGSFFVLNEKGIVACKQVGCQLGSSLKVGRNGFQAAFVVLIKAFDVFELAA